MSWETAFGAALIAVAGCCDDVSVTVADADLGETRCFSGVDGRYSTSMRKELMTRFLIAGAAATALSLAPVAGANPPLPCGEVGAPACATAGPDGASAGAPGTDASAGPDGASAMAPGTGAQAGPDGAAATVPGAGAQAGPDGAAATVPGSGAQAGPDGAGAFVPGAGAVAGPDGASATVPNGVATAGPGGATFCVPGFCADAGR